MLVISNDEDELAKYAGLTWPEVVEINKNLQNQLGELVAMKEQGDMVIKDS